VKNVTRRISICLKVVTVFFDTNNAQRPCIEGFQLLGSTLPNTII